MIEENEQKKPKTSQNVIMPLTEKDYIKWTKPSSLFSYQGNNGASIIWALEKYLLIFLNILFWN